jgi:signal transduction histidine kinase
MSTDARALAVLIVDDSEDDAFILRRHLERAGFAVTSTRVDTLAGLETALAARRWDVVLCDYSMPRLAAMEAFAAVGGANLDVPFILVSGAVGEEAAVACMKAGVHDFILKDRLARLVPAIEREMVEAARRQDQRTMRGRLVRAERVLVLGEMAAGISHDLRNVLHPIAGFVQHAERAVERADRDEAKENLAQIRRLLELGVRTTERLRDFARPAAAEKVVDLRALAREAVAIAKSRMSGGRVRPSRVVDEMGGTAPIRARADEVVSSIVNVFTNAVDAMPGGGTIRLRSGERDGRVFFEIEDDGPGMVAEVKARAFEPFFSTKGEHGTGLGLAMVQACVQRHGGAVDLATEPGKGTRVTLWFPLA